MRDFHAFPDFASPHPGYDACRAQFSGRRSMTNPVLVEVTRSGRVESRHRGAVAVVDSSGKTVFSLGDITAPVYPRSAVKAMQALPLVESGAADAFAFRDRELALAQASHGGEPAHVEGVTAMLTAIGCRESDLECGVHAPSHFPSSAELIRQGRSPSQLHNNCSGKHANFLAVAQHLGIERRGYVAPGHAVQQLVREALASLTGAPHGEAECGVDGCSIPTYATPLSALALGFARFATGRRLAPARAAAARRLYEAAVREPFFIAGTERFCTDAMLGLQGGALLKTGAEGVFCAAISGQGLGVALKCDDGATRAAEAMMAAVLVRLMPEAEPALRRWMHASVRTRRGAEIGEVRAVAEPLRAGR
jgi:L-asparaginase II